MHLVVCLWSSIDCLLCQRLLLNHDLKSIQKNTSFSFSCKDCVLLYAPAQLLKNVVGLLLLVLFPLEVDDCSRRRYASDNALFNKYCL